MNTAIDTPEEKARTINPALLEWMLLANNLPTEDKEYAVSTEDDTVFLATYDSTRQDFDSYYPVLHWAEIR